jgi:hypothetical protein
MREWIKYMLLYLPLLLWMYGCKQTTNKTLSPVIINNKIGYIDNTGNIRIPARFIAGEDFSEGLANVRVEGIYGYIDEKGEWVIPAQYDYAQPFSEGLAVVYKNGRAGCINRNGAQIHPFVFAHIDAFRNGIAIVMTFSHKQGIINKSGKLIADTVYRSIDNFNEGYAIVAGDSARQEYTIIDSTGRLLINYGSYNLIEENEHGYFKAHFTKREKTYTGFLDHTGKLVFSLPDDGEMKIIGNPHDGLIRVRRESDTGREYIVFMNMQGKVVLGGPYFTNASDFSEGRAFVEWRNTDVDILIDKKGHRISNNTFQGWSPSGGFKNGQALISEGSSIALIDTSGQYIIPPVLLDVYYPEISGDYIFFGGKSPYMFNDSRSKGGFARRDGKIILQPTMDTYDPRGFLNGLVQCIIAGKSAYVDQMGNIIWQQKNEKPAGIRDMNIDFRQRIRYPAYDDYPTYNNEDKDTVMSSQAINITNADSFPAGKLSLIAYPTLKDTCYDNYNGFKVHLINNTNQPVLISTNVGALPMVMQAMSPDGQWENIESFEYFDPGDNYTATLQKGQYWSYTCIRYTGSYKTLLRLALTYAGTGSGVIYSNEFEGSINPGQLWREKDKNYPYLLKFMNEISR